MTRVGPMTGSEDHLPNRGYVRDLFEWLAPHYDAAVVTYSLGQDLRWKAELLRHLSPRPGETALDLACGTGLVYDRLVRRLGPDAVLGLDVNRAMLSRARSGAHRRQLIRGDSVRLPFRNASFDLVTAGYLFKYVPLDRLASEVRRVLRPGGRFGGYDFSAPLNRTISGRLYGRYLQNVLPFLGRHLGGGDPGWEALLEFLARVATVSGWESHAEEEFVSAGFDRVEQMPSLGGAITWFWAWSPPTR